jgi:hypothetical protein
MILHPTKAQCGRSRLDSPTWKPTLRCEEGAERCSGTTEELRNALQTKGEQGKFGPGYAGGEDDCPE